jgi:uncharacterized membrane protein YkvA (DUF1232 family)
MTETIARPLDEAVVAHGFFRKLRRVLRRVPLAAELLAAYYCATDPTTPTHVRAILLGALAYFVVPTDAVPDFLGAIGYADDMTILIAAINHVRGHIKPNHRDKARDFIEREGA